MHQVGHRYKLLFLILTAIFVGAVGPMFNPVSADEYAVCEEDPSFTLAQILECRANIARQNSAGRGVNTDPFFSQNLFQTNNFSLLSWITTFVNWGILGIFVYWGVLVIKAAVQIIQSAGNPEGLLAGQKQIVAVMRSVAAMFGFILILLLAGNFFGIGYIWEWPKSFSQCPKHNNDFYFSVRLRNPGVPVDC